MDNLRNAGPPYLKDNVTVRANTSRKGARLVYRTYSGASFLDDSPGPAGTETGEPTCFASDVIHEYDQVLNLQSHLNIGTLESDDLDSDDLDSVSSLSSIWFPEATPSVHTTSGHCQDKTWRDVLYHGSVSTIKDWLEKHSHSQPALLNGPIAEEDHSLALHVAAVRGADYTKLLLDAGAYVNRTSSSNGTALQWAASTGDRETVKLLINYGAFVNAKAGWKGTALIAAVRARRPSVVELLLRHHADPEQLDLYRFSSALSAATDLQSIRLLLENGADVHNITRDTHALIKAVESDNTAIVWLLLRYGANPNMQWKNTSLLDYAAAHADAAIVETLLDHGAILQPTDSENLLARAAMNGDHDIAKLLLSRGMEPDSQDEKYGSPLTAAASKGDIHMITILLKAGADINLFHKVHGSPLLAAMLAGHGDAARFLLERGADILDPALGRKYIEFGEFTQGFGNANNSIRIANIMFPWEIPSVLDLAPGVRKDMECSIARELEDHLVLVAWPATDDRGKEVLRTEATTCSEYLQRRWGSLGRHLLGDIARFVFYDTYELFRCTHKEEGKYDLAYSFQIDTARRNLCLSFDYAKCSQDAPIFELISAIDWICRAVRTPLSGDTMISSSLCHISGISQTQLTSQTGGPSPSGPILGIQLTFTLSKNTLNKTSNDCWHQLFESFFVVEVSAPAVGRDDTEVRDNKPITDKDDPEAKGKQSSPPFGKGLELSFDVMAALAAVEYPVIIENRLVLVGYHTVLIPTEFKRDYVQFHLEVNKDAQINPYALSYKSTSLALDYRLFKSKRCFVGWCENAHIMLGTRGLSAGAVRYTNSQEKRKTLHLAGLSGGFQALSSGPIQAGVTGQANFSFVTNKISFSPSTVYAKMLRNTANEVVIIYDVAAKRSWLVPKLSMLLHMAHVWVKENTRPDSGDESDLKDPVPFADPHHDGLAIVTALENMGDTVICGEGEDAFRLRSLLLGLNINLLQAMTATEPSASRTLYGFELMDVVTEPGKGSVMKKITISRDAQTANWRRLANLVDSVIVCSDIGDVIMPVESAQRRSPLCNCLPSGFDFLAAHVSCVAQLTKRAGHELVSTNIWTSEIKLDHTRCWNFTGEPFKSCDHDDTSEDTCWETHNLFQKVRKIGQSRNYGQPSQPMRMCLNGAVVFGDPFRI